MTPGDQIVADRDGVLAVSAAEWADVAAGVEALEAEEAAIRAALARGERLAGLIGLEGAA
ncbi:MAG TPA: hypothetical protein VM184_04230 [Gaiellaceae bacterium]|nr:hypothetical protein [Gaiellaceae bacterium]